MRRRLRFLIFTLIASLIAGLVSYATVRILTQNASVADPVPRQILDRARALRSFNNELVALTQQYAERVPAPPAPIPGSARRWIEQEFQAELRQLRQRLDIVPDGEAGFSVMKSAAEAVSVMAANPTDATLRERTLAQVARASEGVEAQIDAWKARQLLGEPVRRVQF